MIRFDLETERFTLRPMTEAHLGDLQAILSDPDIVKMLLGDASTPEGIEKEARKWIDDDEFWARHRLGSWGVFDRDGAFGPVGALLGIAAASPPEAVAFEWPEIYYFVKRDCWGKGVAHEAAARMCRYLFEDLEVPALEASIFAEVNPGSVRVAQKLGMQAAGRVSLRVHGITNEQLEEVVRFDFWRIRTARADALETTLGETVFRIGQTVAEDVSTMAERRAEILATLEARTADGENQPGAHADLIDRRLAEGMAAKGLALYRVRREEFRGQTHPG